MKKKYWAALAAGTAAGLWCVRRDRKYPVCRELRFVNKLVVPGCAVSLKTVKMANRVLSRLPLPEPPGDVERRRVQISSEDGAPVPLTVYRPKDLGRDAPCLVYFHGGGFCMGDQGYIHRYAAQYAREAGCVVVFVHYRTADEAPFPRPFWDCYAALGWAWDRAPELGADRARFAVGGDSAGGALAAACALRARDEGNIRLCFQLLVYPVTDCRMETASMQRFTDTPMWNAPLNRRIWPLYLRDGDHNMPQYAAPMLSDRFDGLPPAYVEVEEFDCLHDEGAAYARALEAAGVAVQLEDVRGTFHGFDFFQNAPCARTMVQKRVQALHRAFRQ